MAFEYTTRIHLHHTDAGGILFFSRQFEIVHAGYEALLEALGFGFPRMLENESYFLPIVHAEWDYQHPLRVGDRVTLEMACSAVGRTSFTLTYRARTPEGRDVGRGRTVHVSTDKRTRQKIILPEDLRSTLESFQKTGSVTPLAS